MSQKCVQTTCPYCGVGCGMDITVTPKTSTQSDLETLQVRVIGSESHPANFGRLCIKGSATGETVDFDGRMLEPQVNCQVVSWDSALTTVADSFKKSLTNTVLTISTIQIF